MESWSARLSRALQVRPGGVLQHPAAQPARQPGRPVLDLPPFPLKGEPTRTRRASVGSAGSSGCSAKLVPRPLRTCAPGSVLRSGAVPSIPPPLRHGARKALLVPRRLIGLAAPQAARSSGASGSACAAQAPASARWNPLAQACARSARRSGVPLWPGCREATPVTGLAIPAFRSWLRHQLQAGQGPRQAPQPHVHYID